MHREPYTGLGRNRLPMEWLDNGKLDVSCASLSGVDCYNVNSFSALVLGREGLDNRHTIRRLEALGVAAPIVGEHGKPLVHVGRRAAILAALPSIGLRKGPCQACDHSGGMPCTECLARV